MKLFCLLATLETLLGWNITCAGMQENKTIVEQPQNQTIWIGQSTIFRCKFNRPVMCVWHTNNSLYSTPSRVHFVSTFNNGHSDDCSINITTTRMADTEVSWQCTKIKDDYYDVPDISEEAWLSAAKPKGLAPTYPVIKLDTEGIQQINFSVLISSNNSTLMCISENKNSPAKLYWRFNTRIFNGFVQHRVRDDVVITRLIWDTSANLLHNFIQCPEGGCDLSPRGNRLHQLLGPGNYSELQCIANHQDYEEPQIATVLLNWSTNYIQDILAPRNPVIKLHTEEIQNLNVSVLLNSSNFTLECNSETRNSPAKLYWKLNKMKFEGVVEHHEAGDVTKAHLYWDTTINLLQYLSHCSMDGCDFSPRAEHQLNQSSLNRSSVLQCVATHPDYGKPRIATVLIHWDTGYLQDEMAKNRSYSIANSSYNNDFLFGDGYFLIVLVCVAVIGFLIGPILVLIVFVCTKKDKQPGW